MKSIILTDAYVEDRLSEWGEWFARDVHFDIGFPSKNIIARARDQGGQLISATGSKPLMSNTKAEEIEAILMLLNAHAPVLAHAVIITYSYPDAPLFIAMTKYGYRKSNYYKRLHMGVAWVKGYLIAKKHIENFKKNFSKNISKKSFTNSAN